MNLLMLAETRVARLIRVQGVLVTFAVNVAVDVHAKGIVVFAR